LLHVKRILLLCPSDHEEDSEAFPEDNGLGLLQLDEKMRPRGLGERGIMKRERCRSLLDKKLKVFMTQHGTTHFL
jgi:hypothetical protein